MTNIDCRYASRYIYGFVIKVILDEKVVNIFNDKSAKIWIFAEILFFVLIGAEVDIKYMTAIGLLGIVLGLIIRSIGIFISLGLTNLNKKKRCYHFDLYTKGYCPGCNLVGISL